ncbi:MAG TPA: YtxH domain-containing protein [Bacteroidia bacterium]|mgnify:CR=1 FL=1|nr:YtxH domain-containing protein [Bacteroidia bacterium]
MSNSKLIVAAGLVGVGIGFLLAPKKGEDLRRSILDSIDELGGELVEVKTKIQNITDNLKTSINHAGEQIKEKIENTREGIEDVKAVAGDVKTIFS